MNYFTYNAEKWGVSVPQFPNPKERKTSPILHNNISIDQELDFIRSHFEEPIFPRTISTKTTEGRQILVYNNEALAMFKAANYLDCKISAYPKYVEWQGIYRQAPNLIFIDQDLGRFNSKLALDLVLNKTLQNIKDKLGGGKPTVIWSGHGYHIYLPVKGLLLELEGVFKDLSNEPSRKFIQFAEEFLSDGKADPEHWKHVSFKNCMIRIPGSINSKNGQEVKLIQQWDNKRVEINYLLRDFRRYLIGEKFKPRPAKKQFIVYSTKWSKKR